MSKLFLKTTLIFSLLGITTSINAAPTVGEWTAKFWDDSTNSNSVITWNICIQNNGDWYISSLHTGWKGKWFSKGNDSSHLQAIRSSGLVAGSFDVTKVNNTTLSGYYKWIDNAANKSGYHTTLLTYKGATCSPYIP